MRIINNSFIGGEISPELFGRHDLKAYFQSAQSLHNFEVRKTGGIRKRAGTELVAYCKQSSKDCTYRTVPYIYDRTRYLIFLFYVEKGSTTLRYKILYQNPDITKDNLYQTSAAYTTVAQIPDGQTLLDYKIKQIGDTLFFSLAGSKTFYGSVDFVGRSVKWHSFEDKINVAAAPSLSAKAENFDTDKDKGFRPAVRSYALFGVKDGVFSTPRTRDVTVYLYWVAGATVTLSFTPQWQNHDYYVLAQKTGASWGVMHTFFPNLELGNQSDVRWVYGGLKAETEYNGKTYYTSNTSENNGWEKMADSANKVESSYHTNAIIIGNGGGIQGQYQPSSTIPILGVRIWFGAKLREKNNSSAIGNVGSIGSTTVKLLRYDGTNYVQLTTWSVNAIYSSEPITLTIPEPKTASNGYYRLEFDNDENHNTIIRGIAFLSDVATQTYIDNNISPGEITGIQTRLTVGDTGMDCGVIDVWEQRLMMANSPLKPFTLWFSQAGDVYNFYANRPQIASDAFSATIPATIASRILHSVSNRWLLLFTESGEYLVDSVGNQGFGYNTITIKRTSNVGSHNSIPPVVTEDRVLFVPPTAKSVYDIQYSLEVDNFVPTNRSLFVGHLFENKSIVKITYCRYPEPTLFCLMDDGSLIAMTYIPDQDVFAWHHHTFGGGPKCIDINSLESVFEREGCETISETILTFIDEKDNSRVYIERIRPHTNKDVIGLEDICADHMKFSKDQFLSDGKNPQHDVEAECITLRPESINFNSMGQYKNIYDCCFRLRRSGIIQISPYGNNEFVQCHTTDAPKVDGSGNATLITKDVKILPKAFHNGDGQMVIRSTDKYPCEILSILFNSELGE